MSFKKYCIAALAAIAGLSALHADPVYPSKYIRFVIPFAPGGTANNMARIYGDYVGKSLGQPVVVEAKTGAGGAIAGQFAARAPADGYTLLFVNDGPNAMLQATNALSYDPVKDFQPITNLYTSPMVLTVPTSLKVNTVAELVALAKTRKDGLSYGTQGLGASGHVVGSMLQQATGLPMTVVPYPGGAPMYVDLVGGRLDFSVGVYGSILNFVQSGSLKVIAVISDKRWDRLPDVPTMAEVGYPSVNHKVWFGVAAPNGTPPDIVSKLHKAFVDASKDPVVARALDASYFQSIVSASPAEYKAFMAQEAKLNLDIAKRLGLDTK